MTVDKRTNKIPQEHAVSHQTGPSGPKDPAGNRSPEHQYKPQPGDDNNFTPGSGAPKGPVNIAAKGKDETSKESDATEEMRRRTTPHGKQGGTSLPEE